MSFSTADRASANSVFAFDADIGVTPDLETPSRFHAMFSDRWHIGDKTNGGYLLAVATRAMGAALEVATGGAHPHPFTVTGHFLRPGDAGPAGVDTEVERGGRKLATVTAALSQGGKERIRTVASFGDLSDADGLSVADGAPPDLPPVEDCLERGADRTLPLNDHKMMDSIESRMHPETGFLVGRPPSGNATMRGYLRFVDGRPPDVWSLPFFADAMAPSIFEVLEDRSWVPTIELTVHVRGVPAPGWLRCVTLTRFLRDGYFEEDGEIWDSTGRLVAVSRQLAMVFRP